MLRILLVEDNVVNQKLVRSLLERRGHEVEVSGNGRERAALETGEFDLVLMDCPDAGDGRLRGREVIASERGGNGAHMPVIALTANAMNGDRDQCLAAGMDDYLTKPLHTEKLWAAIDRLVGANAVSAITTRLAAKVGGNDEAEAS